MHSNDSRRHAIKAIAYTGAAAATLGSTGWLSRVLAQPEGVPPDIPAGAGDYSISLAQWSLNKPLGAGEIHHLDFAAEARTMGFDAIEYVNSFFKDRAADAGYLAQMNRRASDQGVRQVLIMCDGEGNLGDPDEAIRTQAVENHRKWLEAAKTLGCHSIRVNAHSQGTYTEQQHLCADGLNQLCQIADTLELNVLIENHGGYSSNAQWLAGVIKMADHPRAGTLPDFGNFCMDWSRRDDPEVWYDKYQGTDELMPHAKAVSAKSYAFDEKGNETTIDFKRMIDIVRKHNYTGWIGIEYEGSAHPPREGIRLTKQLLERLRIPTKPSP